MQIKDSGERREFQTGAVRDIQTGKGRCDLMPLDMVGEILNSDELREIAAFTKNSRIEHLFASIRSFATHENFTDAETMFLEVAKHFEDGAKKYGENNWQKGIPTHCYIDSAVRHFLKHRRGDVDEPHNRAFVWNLLCCAWTTVNKPELNDFAKEKGNEV